MTTLDGAGRAGAAGPVRGLLAGLATTLLVAYPGLWAASLAHSAFSGCWLTCAGTPSPVGGTALALVGAALLAAPFVVGLAAARVRSRWPWLAAALVVVAVVGGLVLFSIDPDNADFFVTLGE